MKTDWLQWVKQKPSKEVNASKTRITTDYGFRLIKAKVTIMFLLRKQAGNNSKSANSRVQI